MTQNLAAPDFYTFNPDEVMACLARGDWSGCWGYLQQLLENLTGRLNMGGNIRLQTELSDDDKKNYAQTFGALAGELILALLMDPSAKLPDKNFEGLIFCHETLHGLFTLFGHENTDAAVTAVIGSSKTLSETQQKKMLLLLGLKTDLDLVALLRRTDTKYRVPALASYFSYLKIFEPKIYANKVKLYALRHDLEKAATEYRTMLAALATYFRCSYLNIETKHSVKENINTAIQRHLAAMQRDLRRIKQAPKRVFDFAIDPSKPKLAVVLESFAVGHAMNRSWGDWVRSLSSSFNVMILLLDQNCDERLRAELGSVVSFSNLGEFAAALYSYEPDMMVMPSVGMSYFGVVAANARWAPVQVMGLGHPATTLSPFIDFVYGGSALYDPQAFPKDRYIADDAPFKFVPNLSRDHVMAIQVPHRQAGDACPLRVGVVGALQKISAPFLDLLRDIEAGSPHPLHFSFQFDSIGMDTLYVQKALAGMFRDYSFCGWQSYPQYFESLKSADIVLNPISFGHTNTVIDTLLLGKPCVGLWGSEPALRTEGYILDIVGLRDMFAASNLDEYKSKFYKLAQRIVAGDTEFFDRGQVYDRLYGNRSPTDFGAALRWVYDHKREMDQSGRSYFSVFETLT